MLLYGVTPTTTRHLVKCLKQEAGPVLVLPRKAHTFVAIPIASVVAAATLVFSGVTAAEETLSNIPQTLDSEQHCSKRYKIQHPKSRKAESCIGKCVTTCIQAGEGPFNITRPLVVFKDGFRTRKYCLSECSDICNLIGDGDDWP